MREYLTILLVGLALSLSGAVLAAQAAEAKGAPERAVGTSERTEVAPKAQTCRPRWPYIVLTCNA